MCLKTPRNTCWELSSQAKVCLERGHYLVNMCSLKELCCMTQRVGFRVHFEFYAFYSFKKYKLVRLLFKY